VAHAKGLLAVAAGETCTAAAGVAGRSTGDTVARWVSKFNREGLAALEHKHGGGPARKYGVAERERIVAMWIAALALVGLWLWRRLG
jgi:transposase